MQNVRNYKDIKLVTAEKRRKRLNSEPNYRTHKNLSDHLIAIQMKNSKVKMTKSIYLGLSILDISKTLTYKFLYYYIKLKYEYRARLCYMILIALLFILKLKIFIKAFRMMLKNGSIHPIMMKMTSSNW